MAEPRLPPGPVTLRLSWNGRPLSPALLDSGAVWFDVPRGTARVGVNELAWSADASVVIRQIRFSDDPAPAILPEAATREIAP